MPDLLPLLGIFLGLFAMIGLLWLVLWKLGLLKDRPRAAPDEIEEADEGPDVLPFRRRAGVCSKGELAFYRVLCEAVRLLPEPRPLIFPSVRLAEVVEVDPDAVAGDRSGWRTAQNKIDRKQADFILCDPATTRPLLILELDDRTHTRRDRAERDEKVDAIAKAAGLPLLHVPAQASYDPAKVARQIGPCLAPPPMPG